MFTTIWTFQTPAGAVRLLLGGRRDVVQDARAALQAAANVADDINEFTALAGRIAIESGLVIGDVIRSLPPERPRADLEAVIDQVCSQPDRRGAVEAVVAALKRSPREQIEALASAEDWAVQRARLRVLRNRPGESADDLVYRISQIIGPGAASLLFGYGYPVSHRA